MRTPQRKSGKYTHDQPDYNITEKKFNEHVNELHKLKTYVVRPAISEVKRLALMGDFSENAAYQIAKGRLRGINRRMLELENMINKANIISVSDSSVVGLGSRLKIEMNGKQKEYEILGSSEVDPLGGVISNNSPIGMALMGKRVGEEFVVAINNKEQKIKIISVE